MIVKLRLPRTLLWVLNVFIIYTLLFTVFRLLTFILFKPEEGEVGEVISAFLLGFRFDLRWISLLLLPIVAASAVPRFSPYYSVANKKLWSWYLALSTFFVFLIYAIDYGCFAYFRVRLGATVLNFADDTVIAAQMLWEMYPMFWMIAGLITLVLLLRYLFQYLHKKVATEFGTDVPFQRKWLAVTVLLLLFFVYGSLPGPLQWDRAFQQKNDFSGYLSLNPLQSVYSTLHFRKPQFDEHKTKNAYPVLSQWMNWDPLAGTYRRTVQPTSTYFSQKPNVVLVVCESFSMYKSSMSGNRLNTTPYFQSLADSGIFFNRCFSPHFSTARGMFAILTGIPDVQLAKFSTRTEAGKNQHTIINNFEGYSKFYFLGGSPAFNNFEGLLQNVAGVQMMTEGDFVSKPIDVWGISDKALFLEANKTFAQQKEPFFAIIQTADNHPPYTIAEEDKDFVRKQAGEEELEKHGFTSLEEYNAMRYFDYSVEKFMEAAKKETYFQNTLFVFIGDHGVAGNANSVYQPAWTENRITEMHIPLLFYAPGHLPAQQRSEVVSQIDVLPTIAGLTGQKHVNSTLGHDLLHAQNNHSAFFIRHDEGEIGLLTDDFYFTKNILFEKESLQLLNGKTVYSAAGRDSVKKQYSALASAYLETARWMLLNNKQ
ncbi:MAG TPA: LTA synthase family protein [Flavisolibacter sp.]|jgi:phosphoglycerol transferase MdoB-like AlkP superfamily enzyme|nr:LTA synthase family protein [Flavisolibacter sp.]